ncbi:unnamed protein product, partial [Didymodactylos carnosus]
NCDVIVKYFIQVQSFQSNDNDDVYPRLHSAILYKTNMMEKYPQSNGLQRLKRIYWENLSFHAPVYNKKIKKIFFSTA